MCFSAGSGHPRSNRVARDYYLKVCLKCVKVLSYSEKALMIGRSNRLYYSLQLATRCIVSMNWRDIGQKCEFLSPASISGHC